MRAAAYFYWTYVPQQLRDKRVHRVFSTVTHACYIAIRYTSIVSNCGVVAYTVLVGSLVLPTRFTSRIPVVTSNIPTDTRLHDGQGAERLIEMT